MSASRDKFLQRVREAVAAGNRVGDSHALPERGTISYQGGGPDPAARFQEQFQAAGGHCHLAADVEAVVTKVMELVEARAPRRVLLGQGPFVDQLPLADRLRDAGIEVIPVDKLPDDEDEARDLLFSVDVGISGVDALIAETGSVVVRARPGEPRSVSLLPPVHIAVAERSQLVPDLFDLFDGDAPVMPSCLTLITGPSKTGDIELRLVTGVHGPGEIHVILQM